MAEIGERIRELRLRTGMSQKDLSKKLNITRNSIIYWENGSSIPSTEYIIAMAKLFNVTSDYILCLDDDSSIVIRRYNDAELQILNQLCGYFNTVKPK